MGVAHSAGRDALVKTGVVVVARLTWMAFLKASRGRRSSSVGDWMLGSAKRSGSNQVVSVGIFVVLGACAIQMVDLDG